MITGLTQEELESGSKEAIRILQKNCPGFKVFAIDSKPTLWNRIKSWMGRNRE